MRFPRVFSSKIVYCSPTNKQIHQTLTIQRKNKPNHDIRSLFRRAKERRTEEQTTGVNSKSDKQYHEVINIDLVVSGCIYM